MNSESSCTAGAPGHFLPVAPAGASGEWPAERAAAGEHRVRLPAPRAAAALWGTLWFLHRGW